MILGIAGSFGAGKGTAVAYLIRKNGFRHYSSSGFITEEVVRRGLPVNRDTMTIVANDMRAKGGPSYIIDSLYAKAAADGGDAVIESLRAVAEVRRIKELGGIVLGVDAEPGLRYTRAVRRGSAKDGVSYEEFLAQEKRESNPDDPAKQNIFGALAEADYHLDNSGTLDELHTQIDRVLNAIRK